MNRDFLENLEMKLKGISNLRSIYLNCIPRESASKLDIFDTSNNEVVKQENWGPSLLAYLLEKDSFKLEISLEKKYTKIEEHFSEEQKKTIKDHNDKISSKFTKLKKRLDTILSNYEDNLQEYGTRVFGFGYPIIVIRKNDGKKIKAPLIIWNLTIQRNKGKKDTWIIKREEDDTIFFNQPLISYIEKDCKIKLDNISNEMLEDGIIDEDELRKIVDDTCKKLNIKTDFNCKINQVITTEKADKSENDLLVEAGVFGIYKQVKENIKKDIETMKKNIEEWEDSKREISFKQDSYHSSMDTDPSQQTIINSLSEKEHTIIHGPPGTGKSQTLTAIITNALINKNKCLVVCEKKTALEVLNENLKKQGLSRFSVIIENVKLDRKSIVEKARSIEESTELPIRNINNFFEKYDSLIKEENLKRYNVLKKIITATNSNDSKTWKDIIKKFLYNKGEEYKKKGEGYFKNFAFEFTIEELNNIEKKVEDAKNIFFQTNIETKTLNPKYFKDKFTFTKKNNFQQNFENLKEKLKKNSDDLNKNKEKFKNQGIEKLKTYQDKINECFNFFNDSLFVKFFNKNISLSIRSLFSKKFKIVKETKIALTNSYNELRNIHNGDKLFDFNFIEKIRDFNDIKNCFEEYKNKIEEFKFIVDKGDFYDKQFFQGNTLVQSTKDKENNILESLKKTYSTEIFTEEYINKCNIEYLRNNFDSHKEDFLALKKKVDFLIEQEEFQKMYEWLNFFYSLESKTYKIIEILVNKFRDEKTNWLKLFNSFYCNKLLEKKENEVRPLVTDDKKLEEIKKQKKDITGNLIHQVFHSWGEKWKSHKVGFRRIFNLKGSKGQRRNSLKKIVNEHFELFTDLFPVLLLTPEVACTILPLKKDLFDLVIFDEASQLRIEDTYSTYIRGRYKVISGDEKQMPPSNYFTKDITIDNEIDNDDIAEAIDDAQEESLLNFVLNKKLAKTEKYLEFHYRSEHPSLIEFSNKAFYKSKLCPMPPQEEYQPFEFIDVQGIYTDGTNKQEAQKVIEKIKEIVALDYSIGVATFNIKQRDLIKEFIREKLDANILEKLEKKKYFVKNLENIQGDERDIIIISGTYGTNNEDKFRQQFAVSRKNGERLLNVLITRAKRKIIYLNSIPEQYYMRYKDELKEKQEGKELLYAYIDYAKNVANGENKNVENILTLVGSNHLSQKDQEYGLTESPFEEEVLQYIEDKIPKNRIQLQYKVGGFRIDMVIKDEQENPKIAIECDGAAYHSSDLAVDHDVYRQKIIEEQTNLKFYRIFSTNWWHNTKREAEKLINFINSNCQST